MSKESPEECQRCTQECPELWKCKITPEESVLISVKSVGWKPGIITDDLVGAEGLHDPAVTCRLLGQSPSYPHLIRPIQSLENTTKKKETKKKERERERKEICNSTLPSTPTFHQSLWSDQVNWTACFLNPNALSDLQSVTFLIEPKRMTLFALHRLAKRFQLHFHITHTHTHTYIYDIYIYIYWYKNICVCIYSFLWPQ